MFCLYVMHCSWNKYCIYFLLRCGLRSRCPESWEKWHTKKLFLLYFLQRRVNVSVISCKQAFFSVSTVPVTGTVIHTYSDVAWDQCVQRPRRNITLLCSFWNFTQCSLNFTVFLACPQLVKYCFNCCFCLEVAWNQESRVPRCLDQQGILPV